MASNDTPVVLSVVIACFNAEATLTEQLGALAAQDCPVPWEVLVCDNGSTDGSVAVARGFRDVLPLRIVAAAAESGAGFARNTGASQARGEYLAFCDADDVVGHNWLNAMVQQLRENPFIAGRFEQHRLNDARTLRSRTLDQGDGLQYSPTGSPLAHAGAGNMGIRKDIFQDVGGFDTTLRCLEDTDLSWRVQLAGTALRYAPHVIVHVRLRTTYRSMYHQGRCYGSAHAELEQRYPQSHSEPPVPQGAPPRHQVLQNLRLWFGMPPSIGHFLWQLGWHRGYRAGSPTFAATAAKAGDAKAGNNA